MTREGEVPRRDAPGEDAIRGGELEHPSSRRIQGEEKSSHRRKRRRMEGGDGASESDDGRRKDRREKDRKHRKEERSEMKHRRRGSEEGRGTEQPRDREKDEGGPEGKEKERRKEKKERERERKEEKHRRREGKEEKFGEEKKRRGHRPKDRDKEGEEEQRRQKRRMLKEARKYLKEHSLVPGTPAPPAKEASPAKPLPAGVEPISEEDYFNKNPEFATWLLDTRRVFFSSLSSDDSRALFTEFVQQWNGGHLAQEVYNGIGSTAVRRTNHRWNVKSGVGAGGWDQAVAEEEQDRQRALLSQRKKRERTEREVDLETLFPRATGREALVEKRKARREEARAREESPDMLRETDVLGGGADDFQTRLAAEKERRERRLTSKLNAFNEKKSAYEEREAAQLDQFRAMVAMAGGKISIAKRE